MSKILNFLVNTLVLRAQNALKPVFGWGSAADSAEAWGNLRRSPDPLVGWGGGHSLSIPLPLDAFGVSISCLRCLASDLPSSLRLIFTLIYTSEYRPLTKVVSGKHQDVLDVYYYNSY